MTPCRCMWVCVRCCCCLHSGIFKFIDNIMALYSHVAAMMVVVICSVIFLGFTINTTFVCGFVVCVISLFLYHHNPVPVEVSSKADPLAVEPILPKSPSRYSSDADLTLKDKTRPTTAYLD